MYAYGGVKGKDLIHSDPVQLLKDPLAISQAGGFL